jgi:D-arabinose 1-dehydrogenase-like Zn-dependent alcohol dehydrogenase
VGEKVRDVKPGYRVLVGKFTGTEYEFLDGKFTLCLREHIMGVQVNGTGDNKNNERIRRQREG